MYQHMWSWNNASRVFLWDPSLALRNVLEAVNLYLVAGLSMFVGMGVRYRFVWIVPWGYGCFLWTFRKWRYGRSGYKLVPHVDLLVPGVYSFDLMSGTEETLQAGYVFEIFSEMPLGLTMVTPMAIPLQKQDEQPRGWRDDETDSF